MIALVSVVQSILLLASVVAAYLTVREARTSRKESETAREAEAAQLVETRASEHRRFVAEAEKSRTAEREARLRQLVDAIAVLEALRADTLAGDMSAWVRAGPARLQLQTALIATGRDLPHTTRYLDASGPFALPDLLRPALEEIHESLKVYALASHLPFAGEAG